MDTISFMLANMFRDNASVLMALLVFLATGTVAFSLMAFVRVRGAVKRRTARIQEVHLLTIHCLCDGIDCLLLGVEE